MKVNLFLFDDFDTMDAFVPAEVFGKLPEYFHVEYCSVKGDFVTSLQGVKVWTDYLDEQTAGDILVIPGGKGARRLIRDDENLCRLLKKAADQHSFCVMLGSGTLLMAQTGILYRRRICDCPLDKNWNRMFTAAIYRTSRARWVPRLPTASWPSSSRTAACALTAPCSSTWAATWTSRTCSTARVWSRRRSPRLRR